MSVVRSVLTESLARPAAPGVVSDIRQCRGWLRMGKGCRLGYCRKMGSGRGAIPMVDGTAFASNRSAKPWNRPAGA